jgi:hypothetical protein
MSLTPQENTSTRSSSAPGSGSVQGGAQDTKGALRGLSYDAQVQRLTPAPVQRKAAPVQRSEETYTCEEDDAQLTLADPADAVCEDPGPQATTTPVEAGAGKTGASAPTGDVGMSNSATSKSGTTVSGGISAKGAKASGERELVPKSAELKVPVWGAVGAGLWLSVKPSVRVGVSGEIGWDGSGKVKGYAKGQLDVTLKGGIEFGQDPLKGTATLGGGTRLTLDIAGVEIARDPQGLWTVGALNASLFGELVATGELKAKAGDWEYGKKVEWKSPKAEFLKMSLGGWSEAGGLKGWDVKPGQAALAVASWVTGEEDQAQRQYDSWLTNWAERDNRGRKSATDPQRLSPGKI